jgi:hypothetical protein
MVKAPAKSTARMRLVLVVPTVLVIPCSLLQLHGCTSVSKDATPRLQVLPARAPRGTGRRP